MTSEHPVPPDVTSSGERVRSRSAESDFARLPASEVHARTGPGGGPQGPVAAGPLNVPLVVIMVGLALAFATFVISTPVLLVLGLGMVVVGGAMSSLSHRRPGRRGGLGQSPVRDAAPVERRPPDAGQRR